MLDGYDCCCSSEFWSQSLNTLQRLTLCGSLHQGEDLSPQLPRGAASNSSYDYFAPTYALAVDMTDAFDMNTPEYLDSVLQRALAIVRQQADMMPVSICELY